jgi:hypothetical protein
MVQLASEQLSGRLLMISGGSFLGGDNRVALDQWCFPVFSSIFDVTVAAAANVTNGSRVR